jgi:hypothetical protein
MKNFTDNKTGVLLLIPESDADRRILYHITNCADLSQFEMYLANYMRVDPGTEITYDLGVPVEHIHDYPVTESTGEHIHDRISETEPPLSHCSSVRLIGFNRDSFRPV